MIRTKFGRIAYRNAAGAEIGRERFELIAHGGGHILRAFCEMDDIGLLRDVSMAMDRDWRPLDGFCRITKDERTAATTWFGASADEVAVEGFVAEERLSQTLPTDGRLAYIGLHPLQGDALIVQTRGDSCPGVFMPIDGVTNSISPNGDEGVAGTPVCIDVAFVGHGTITVAAGRFTARRYALRWHPDWPPADLWVRQSDCVFLLMRWSLIENWYELTAIEEN